MQVILLERIGHLGQMGDVVNVKNGYARNYLLPQKKALRATDENIAYFETQRVQLEANNLERKNEAEAVGEKLNGKTFVAIRENQTRASFLGVNVRLVRLSAFVIAGSFAGVAGSLMALYLRGMYPESAFWTQSGQVLIMVLLGGMHSFVGPVLGAAALYLLEVTINQYTEYWQIVLGAILLAIVLAAPEGIYGIIRNFISRTRRSDHGDA